MIVDGRRLSNNRSNTSLPGRIKRLPQNEPPDDLPSVISVPPALNSSTTNKILLLKRSLPKRFCRPPKLSTKSHLDRVFIGRKKDLPCDPTAPLSEAADPSPKSPFAPDKPYLCMREDISSNTVHTIHRKPPSLYTTRQTIHNPL